MTSAANAVGPHLQGAGIAATALLTTMVAAALLGQSSLLAPLHRGGPLCERHLDSEILKAPGPSRAESDLVSP